MKIFRHVTCRMFLPEAATCESSRVGRQGDVAGSCMCSRVINPDKHIREDAPPRRPATIEIPKHLTLLKRLKDASDLLFDRMPIMRERLRATNGCREKAGYVGKSKDSISWCGVDRCEDLGALVWMHSKR